MNGKKLVELFDNPNFVKWFGRSRVIDENGAPVVASHTTTTPWDAFDPSLAKESAVYGPGLYAALDKPWRAGVDSVSMDLLIKSENPLDLTAPLSTESASRLSEYLGREINPENGVPLFSLERRAGSVGAGAKAAGFDGIVHYGPGNTGRHIVVFEPTQAKSIDNSGSFDPTNPNIYKSALPLAAAGGLMSALSPDEAAAAQRIRAMDGPVEDAWNPVEAFGGGLGGGVKAALSGVPFDGLMDFLIGRLGGGK